MTLKKTYEAYREQTRQVDFSFDVELNSLTKELLQDGSGWYRGLAFLDYAIGLLPDKKDQVTAFYRRLVTEGLDFKASVYLNDEDYDFHFTTLMAILGKLALHVPEVYAQMAFQFRDNRMSHRDPEKVKYYLERAIAEDVEVAIAIKGYFMYYGILYDEDREGGLAILTSSDDAAKQLYLGYIAVGKGDFEEVPAIIEKARANDNPIVRKGSFLLEGAYLDARNEFEAAKAVYEELLKEMHSEFAMFRLGTLAFFQEGEDTGPAAGFKMWQEAFENGSIEASSYLGFHSLPVTREDLDFDASIHWFKLGHVYGNSFANYRLALIYLFVPHLLDVEQGLKYLDAAVAEQLPDALVEKAELLMEGRLVEKDEAAALALLEKAATFNNAYAINRIAYFYEHGILVADAPDVETAIFHYQRAEELNYLGAINNLGRIYRYGINGTPDLEKAIALFERGLAMGSPYSMTEMAFLYEDGTLEADYQKAFDYFHQAATLDYPFAIHMTGTYLENGYHNQQPDPASAFEWYQKGAALNDANCLFAAGRCYRFGNGVEENPDKALEYYHRSAELGDPKAYVELGLCYEQEYGVSFDAQQAMDYMQRAADLDYYYGQYKLGYYYMHGLVTQDTKKGLELLEKAAEKGFPQAMLEIGDYYLYDYDDIDQSANAIGYYQQAQEQGVVHHGLGLCYEYGIGIEPNAAEAFKYYQQGAEQGYTLAKYHAGKCFLEGIGVKANPEEAFNYFKDAAGYGEAAAQYHAGHMLMQGKGVAMNKEEGLNWLNTAAEENYANAQYALGNCYLMGDGVEEDEDRAMYWFELAADNGHEKAMKLTGRKMAK
ncbi:hypothetical protein PBAL39_24640 [Pedobacter sp. BAL39]|uniref:tetratricopeptide repeat protein n=1 Tax=Pedobacter sp. BAL39 TaxID=391596 RepID=UPI0001559BE4|nr:tetratricopeptide repeat protein [Pedobacter sp. BAL39]EDM36514.1 hypothetical protein PBAL39_24640 [Pedobacter sp. BAL39]